MGSGLLSYSTATGPMSSSISLLLALMTRSLVPLFFTAALLAGTRAVIVRRAFVGHRSLLMNIFRPLDQFFKNLNDWTTGGIELVGESRALPGNDPATWRDRNKKSLGQFRWFVRVLFVLESPTLFICVTAVISNQAGGGRVSSSLLILLWIFATVLTAVKGASLFSQERSRQTLEPLLSTTLSSREFTEQKVVGANRLLMVLGCPIVTVFLTQAYMNLHYGLSFMATYLGLSILLVFVILRTTVWISSAVGIWIRSQTKAITVSIVTVVLLAVLLMIPAVAVQFVSRYSSDDTAGLQYYLQGLGAPGSIAAVESTFLTRVGFGDFRYQVSGTRARNFRSVRAAQVVLPAVLIQLAYLLVARWMVLRMTPILLQRVDQHHSRSGSLFARHRYG